MTWGFCGIYAFEARAGGLPGTYYPKLAGGDLLAQPARPDAPLGFVVFAEQDQWAKQMSSGYEPYVQKPVQLQLQGQYKWLAADSAGGLGPMVSEQPSTLYYSSGAPSQQLPVIALSSGDQGVVPLCLSPVPGSEDVSIGWMSLYVNARAGFRLTCLAPAIAQIITAGGARGADFSTVNLDRADFGGRAGHALLDLSRCRFNNCSLRSARLSSVNLSYASMAGADLLGADLQGAQLAGATLAGVNLSGADLRGATVDGLDLTGADLAGTNFSGLDVTNVKFGPSPKFSTDPKNLTRFTGATLPFSVIGLNWSYLDLAGASILGIPVDQKGHLALSGLQAVAANLSGRLFSNANLRSSGAVTNFSGATLVGANFSGADCTRANFTGATLGGGPGQAAAVMSTATLFDAIFDDAQLSGVNFSGAYLYGAGASVSGATMAGVDFSNAYLTGLDLSNVRNADMAGAIFDRACCVNCNFRGTTVMPEPTGRGGSFVSACLQGADFTDSALGGADLVNAGCAPACATPGTCKFPATLTIGGSPVTIQITVNNAGTVLPASATTSAAVCPDKSFGPCTGAQLYAADAPTAWPVASTKQA